VNAWRLVKKEIPGPSLSLSSSERMSAKKLHPEKNQNPLLKMWEKITLNITHKDD